MKRLYYAFFHSLNGLHHAFRNEAAFRLEVYGAVILLVVACLLDVTATEKLLLLLSLFVVLITELINTAIEATVDRISEEIHPVSKIIKDVASAAVFLSVIQMIIVWSVIIYQ